MYRNDKKENRKYNLPLLEDTTIKECHAFYNNYHTSPEFLVIYRFRLESIYIDDDIKYFIAIFVEKPNIIIMNNFKPSFYSLVNWDGYK